MKRTGILAIAITAMFCVGFLPFIAGTDVSSAEGDGTLVQGTAYGQNFKLDYETLEKYIADEMAGADLMTFLNGEIEDYVQDMDQSGSVLSLTGVAIQDIDFDLTIASLIEVVTADENGYVLEFEAAIGISASVDVQVTGMLPAAGEYLADYEFTSDDVDERTVNFGFDVSASIAVDGTMDIAPNGDVESMTIGLEVSGSVALSSGVQIAFTETGVAISYTNVVYRVSADAQVSLEMTLTPNVDVYEISFGDLSITGGIYMNSELKSFIDSIFGENYVDENILNMTVGDDKIIDNGRLALNDLLADADINAILADLGVDTTIPYETATAEDVVNSFNVYGMLTNGTVGGFLPEGSETLLSGELFAGLETKALTAEEVNDIKTAIDDVKASGDGGSGGNTMLYVGIGAAVVVLVLVAFVFVRKH